MFYLYIIQSETTGRFYIGITHDPEKRIKEHNSGSVKSTKAYRPYHITHIEQYPTKTLARKREIELKNHGQKKRSLLQKMNNRTASGAVSACGIRGCSPPPFARLREKEGVVISLPHSSSPQSGEVFCGEIIKHRQVSAFGGSATG